MTRPGEAGLQAYDGKHRHTNFTIWRGRHSDGGVGAPDSAAECSCAKVGAITSRTARLVSSATRSSGSRKCSCAQEGGGQSKLVSCPRFCRCLVLGSTTAAVILHDGRLTPA